MKLNTSYHKCKKTLEDLGFKRSLSALNKQKECKFKMGKLGVTNKCGVDYYKIVGVTDKGQLVVEFDRGVAHF